MILTFGTLVWDSVAHRRSLQKLISEDNKLYLTAINLAGFIPVTSGVPQGSVLGPLLFTMFVNEIPSIVSSPLLMFADDIKIFRVIRNGQDYTFLLSTI